MNFKSLVFSVCLVTFFCKYLPAQIMPSLGGFSHAPTATTNQPSNALRFSGTPDMQNFPMEYILMGILL